jgi:hypothetical protein
VPVKQELGATTAVPHPVAHGGPERMPRSLRARPTARRASIVAIVSVASLALWGSTATAASSGVRPALRTICDPNTIQYSLGGTKTADKVLHDSVYHNEEGNSTSVTVVSSEVASITAGVTVEQEVNVSASVLIADLGSKVNVTLAASGSITKTSSTSVTTTIGGVGDYAVYDGEHKYTGSWTGVLCNGNGTAETNINGTATSWAVSAHGNASCAKSYTSGTFPALAKSIACD